MARVCLQTVSHNSGNWRLPCRQGLWCAVSVIALCVFTPSGAAAQFNRARIIVDLTQQASQSSASVTTTVRPACTMRNPVASVRVADLLPAAAFTNKDSDPTQVFFRCNTPTARVSIASSGELLNPAPVPTGRAATKFTTSLPFSARADLLDIGQTSGQSVWVMSDNSAVGPTNLTVGEGTGQRLRTVSVKAASISSRGRIPVAGTYTGSICVGVDPAGILGAPQCNRPALAPIIGVEE